jgi:hypothetical protein
MIIDALAQLLVNYESTTPHSVRPDHWDFKGFYEIAGLPKGGYFLA